MVEMQMNLHDNSQQAILKSATKKKESISW